MVYCGLDRLVAAGPPGPRIVFGAVVVLVVVAVGHSDAGVGVVAGLGGHSRRVRSCLEAEMARIVVKHHHIVAVGAGIRAVVDRSLDYSLVVDIGCMGLTWSRMGLECYVWRERIEDYWEHQRTE